MGMHDATKCSNGKECGVSNAFDVMLKSEMSIECCAEDCYFCLSLYDCVLDFDYWICVPWCVASACEKSNICLGGLYLKSVLGAPCEKLVDMRL